MNDYSQMTVLMERIIHKYNQWENRKRTYGTKMLLTRSEIHTIAAVGDNPGINITLWPLRWELRKPPPRR